MDPFLSHLFRIFRNTKTKAKKMSSRDLNPNSFLSDHVSFGAHLNLFHDIPDVRGTIS